MKRVSIVEDWSRFNRAVLEVADGLLPLAARKQSVPQKPKREPPDPGDSGDAYGLIARHKWRKHG